MTEAKKDYISFTNFVGWVLAVATAIGVFAFFQTTDAGFLALLAGGLVLVIVTFGLNYLFQHFGGLGGVAVALMSATSFGVAVVQAYIWWHDWPIK
ncbi:hypothetical protein [Agrobacterium salinitolerans]|uniref:hypothetical protein n=1 Tax=Agrobacterium salinitolerans TaxID=1183413 RepID=UPI0015728EAC|nr:hypothetical protein [Agrobacterium salinitolerans]NTA40106.1 hypothetical protein [Agrobacterium salinitolerans]